MPVDEISERLLRIFGRFILRFLVDIVFEVCCYFIGKVFLRIFTLESAIVAYAGYAVWQAHSCSILPQVPANAADSVGS